MIETRDECVECGKPCIGKSCKYMNVIVKTCDVCGEEVEHLYWYEGEQMCEECAMDRFKETLEEVQKDE